MANPTEVIENLQKINEPIPVTRQFLVELREDLASLIQEWAWMNQQILNPTRKPKYDALVTRYNTLSTLLGMEKMK